MDADSANEGSRAQNEALSSELTRLRARAYGPHADIHTDPIAVGRLRELEQRTTKSASPLAPEPLTDLADAACTDAPLPDAPSPATSPSNTSPPENAVDSLAVTHSAPSPPRKLRWRTPALWAGSVIASILLTTAVCASVIDASHEALFDAEATQVAILAEDTFWDVPDMFGGPTEEVIGFEQFYGLRAFTQPLFYGTGVLDECLSVVSARSVEESENGSFEGIYFQGCGAGTFPAAASFNVGPDAPEELRAAFPNGTSLQFVLEADTQEVVVFRSHESESINAFRTAGVQSLE